MQRGFTLVEVLISVGIFILIAGGIFQAVSTATSASSEIGLARLEADRLDSFDRFTRSVFANLPGDATFDLRVRQGGRAGSNIELLLTSTPSLADFSRNGTQTGGLALSARPDQSGAYTLCAANFDGEASASDRDKALEAVPWIPLLQGVRQIRWRFQSPDRNTLEETWQTDQGRPVLVDLDLVLASGEVWHSQFLIPKVSAPQGAPGASPRS